MNDSKTFRVSYNTTRAAIKAADATVSAFSTAGNTVASAWSDLAAGIRRARADAKRAYTGMPVPRY
jgi:hypothetical protein